MQHKNFNVSRSYMARNSYIPIQLPFFVTRQCPEYEIANYYIYSKHFTPYSSDFLHGLLASQLIPISATTAERGNTFKTQFWNILAMEQLLTYTLLPLIWQQNGILQIGQEVYYLPHLKMQLNFPIQTGYMYNYFAFPLFLLWCCESVSCGHVRYTSILNL